MTLKEKIMNLQTYKMFVGEDTVYVEREDILKLLYKEPTTKNDLGVDWDELKRRILMEVDGGTDDKYLRYCDVCDRISNTIDEFVSDMRGEEE